MNAVAIRAVGVRESLPETMWLNNPATGHFSPSQSAAYRFATPAAADLALRQVFAGLGSEIAEGFWAEMFDEVPVEPDEAA